MFSSPVVFLAAGGRGKNNPKQHSTYFIYFISRALSSTEPQPENRSGTAPVLSPVSALVSGPIGTIIRAHGKKTCGAPVPHRGRSCGVTPHCVS